MLNQISLDVLVATVGIIIVVNGSLIGFILKQLTKFQYKDSCTEIVKRQDERHNEILNKLDHIDQRLDKVLNGR